MERRSWNNLILREPRAFACKYLKLSNRGWRVPSTRRRLWKIRFSRIFARNRKLASYSRRPFSLSLSATKSASFVFPPSRRSNPPQNEPVTSYAVTASPPGINMGHVPRGDLISQGNNLGKARSPLAKAHDLLLAPSYKARDTSIRHTWPRTYKYPTYALSLWCNDIAVAIVN